ncbi:hypothetical protein ACEPPN_015761 [Leptodophora sp. 'Broadleaf-Isolate-01']
MQGPWEKHPFVTEREKEPERKRCPKRPLVSRPVGEQEVPQTAFCISSAMRTGGASNGLLYPSAMPFPWALLA